jgi:hypothetical protein
VRTSRFRFSWLLAGLLFLQWGNAFAHCLSLASVETADHSICITPGPADADHGPAAQHHPVCPVCCQLSHIALPAAPEPVPAPVLIAVFAPAVQPAHDPAAAPALGLPPSHAPPARV